MSHDVHSKRIMFILGCIFLTMLIVLVWALSEISNLQLEAKKYKYALRDYAIVNKDYVTLNDIEEEIGCIKKECSKAFVPYKLLYAMGEYEKGMGTNWWGVQRIALDIQKHTPIDKWQLLMAIRIVKQEMKAFALDNGHKYDSAEMLLEYVNEYKKKFVEYLHKRYCPKNERWAKDVYWLWITHERRNK